ncbi:MAG TPA: TetR/AcrR family transcriptional regulator [Sulfuricaulis sp.]|nr:TetR/AcrR family transcriptional regulator [Sulfuricaulis sp.]
MAVKPTRDKILDAALDLAGKKSWESVRLHDVAAEMGITLNDIREHFREKEDLTDAWFDRADASMLQEAAKTGFQKLSSRQRVHRLIMTWLTALTRYRRVTRQMIYGKLEPGHVHYQFSGLLRVSRTVQWIREAAHRDAELPWRAIEETALTMIYLATFFRWMRDDSENAVRTSDFLNEMLRQAERVAACIPGINGSSRESGARSAAP